MTAISWRARADLPLPRAGYAAGAIDGRFIVAGGSYWSGDQKLRTATVHSYDPAADRWSTDPSLPVALSDAVSVATQSAMYVIGGLSSEGASLDTLALRGGRWSAIPELKLPEAKIRAMGAVDRSHIYIVGGQLEFGNEAATDQVWTCDTANPSAGWTALPPCPAGPPVVSAVTVWRGALYLFGGFRIHGSVAENMRGIWRFDLGLHSWTHAGDLPESRRAFWAAPADTEILLFGGYTDEFSAQVQSFDPKTAAVRAVGTLPHAVADAKFSRIGNRWYTTGGEVGVKIRGRHTWEGVSDSKA